MDAAAYTALIEQRLSERTDAFAAVLKQVSQLSTTSEATLHIEVDVAAMAHDFPVAIFLDGPPQTPQVPHEIDVALRAIGPLLSTEEEDRFVVFEDGPNGPQHALKQPILDGVAAEQTLVLPLVIKIAKNAGLEAIGCEVAACLHDSAEPEIIVPRPSPSSGGDVNPAGFMASLFDRK